MIGYGVYHYKYPSGREGDTARVALASNASGFSVYVSCLDSKGWLVEQMKDTLGKVNCGKSCIRFQRVEDLELDAFADLLAIARRARTVGGDSHDAASK
jgi:hypothetical protein